MQDQIFISYSRDQLYYAESVAHALQKQNLNIWFDLQQLAPGTAWAAEIDAALREASRVILIASRSALQSPYVAVEWMHALERHKPIYILLFEEVEFKAFTTEFRGETMLVALDTLQWKAKAIVDGRGNFHKSIKRLSESLASPVKYKDPVPSGNRFRIPQRLPLPVAFVAATMAALTALTLYLTFTVLSAFLPMMIVGLIAAGYYGLQTWEFLQRKSYQASRVVLAIAPLITPLFAFWFTPVAVLALFLAIFSDDVHRWSPRGEGNNPRDLILKGKRPLWQQILSFLVFVPLLWVLPTFLWLILVIWFFLRNRNSYETHRRGETVMALLILSTLLTLIDPILAIPLIFLLTAIAYQRQKPVARKGPLLEVTYRIHADSEDAHVVEDIGNALEYVGLKRLSAYGRDVPPDYQIVVLSNFGNPPPLEELKAAGSKIVVVVASSLMDWERVKEYADYQWVDYRRQEPERLIAMARDLEGGKQSNSFHTRIVPQSFERPVVPTRVFLFLLVQLILYNVAIFRLTRGLATGADVNLVLLIFALLSLGVSFWIVERILERRITRSRILQINIGIAFAANILSLLVGLMQPRPEGSVIDTAEIQRLLLLNVVAVLIFYWIGTYQIGGILKWWLPPSLPPGRGRRNQQLVQVVFVTGLVTVLLTASFFGDYIPVTHERLAPGQIAYERQMASRGLSLDLPAHWLAIPAGVRDDEITPYVLNTPMSAVLLKANEPGNTLIAPAINSYFQSPYAGQSLIFVVMSSVGKRIERTFEIISFSLDPESSPWHPDDYGFPVHTAVYVPDGKVEGALIATVWSFRENPQLDSSIRSVVTRARTASNTRPVSWSIPAPAIRGFKSDITVFQLEEDPGKTVVVMSLDSDGSDYYVTISGPEQILRENQPVLEHILESIGS